MKSCIKKWLPAERHFFTIAILYNLYYFFFVYNILNPCVTYKTNKIQEKFLYKRLG